MSRLLAEKRPGYSIVARPFFCEKNTVRFSHHSPSPTPFFCMKTFPCLAFFGWLLFHFSPANAQNNAQVVREQQLITQAAPIVFVGRPVEGRNYTDSQGKEYFSTLIEVVEVLRGQKALHVGFVEVMDSLPSKNTVAVVPRVIADTHDTYWGVYFCSPNNKPRFRSQYKTTKNTNLQLFRGLQTARIESQISDHGNYIEGLSRAFANEQAVKDYLVKVPNLAPISKPIDAYPVRNFDESFYKRTPTPAPAAKALQKKEA